MYWDYAAESTQKSVADIYDSCMSRTYTNGLGPFLLSGLSRLPPGPSIKPSVSSEAHPHG